MGIGRSTFYDTPDVRTSDVIVVAHRQSQNSKGPWD
jgi:hypothetical protein